MTENCTVSSSSWGDRSGFQSECFTLCGCQVAVPLCPVDIPPACKHSKQGSITSMHCRRSIWNPSFKFKIPIKKIFDLFLYSLIHWYIETPAVHIANLRSRGRSVQSPAKNPAVKRDCSIPIYSWVSLWARVKVPGPDFIRSAVCRRLKRLHVTNCVAYWRLLSNTTDSTGKVEWAQELSLSGMLRDTMLQLAAKGEVQWGSTLWAARSSPREGTVRLSSEFHTI